MPSTELQKLMSQLSTTPKNTPKAVRAGAKNTKKIRTRLGALDGEGNDIPDDYYEAGDNAETFDDEPEHHSESWVPSAEDEERAAAMRAGAGRTLNRQWDPERAPKIRNRNEKDWNGHPIPHFTVEHFHKNNGHILWHEVPIHDLELYCKQSMAADSRNQTKFMKLLKQKLALEKDKFLLNQMLEIQGNQLQHLMVQVGHGG